MDYRTSDLTCAFETKAEGDGSFTAIASTSDIDAHNDVIVAGAFDPIAVNARTGAPDVLMLRDHDRTQIIGGWSSFAQQGHQLVCNGQLCLDVEKARETHALMKRGYLSGISVGFNVPNKEAITFDGRSGKRFIRKATLKECSIVAMPANHHARVLDVKSEDFVAWLQHKGLNDDDIKILEREGFEALIEARKDALKPHGDVDYADPGYQEDNVKRYPIHTEANIRAAWSYINMPRNQQPYTRDQVDKIKSRIIAAWKRKIDPEGPPAAQEDHAPPPEHAKHLPFTGIDGHFPIDGATVANELRGLLSRVKGLDYGHVG